MSAGGCWEPKDCKPRQKVAIIIPYKNREEHLRALLYRLHPMLHRQKTSYCIIVAEQVCLKLSYKVTLKILSSTVPFKEFIAFKNWF